MGSTHVERVDPRIRRTLELLHRALQKLLETKPFDQINVQEIADAATLNRATFYDHYADKVALLECMVAGQFQELLAGRGVSFDGNCGSALKAIVQCVCDYAAMTPNQWDLHIQVAVIAVVRRMILDGLRRHPSSSDVSPEMRAATASWAICGGAREWIATPERGPSEEIAKKVAGLVGAILE